MLGYEPSRRFLPASWITASHWSGRLALLTPWKPDWFLVERIGVSTAASLALDELPASDLTAPPGGAAAFACAGRFPAEALPEA